ncbi:MAG: UTP--glucose-1-phosphate uridylyltransferase GalU [Bacteroidota bacterium]
MVKKAVIPAAGFGTRLLPATKAQPKEMLPIVDKPTIQYVVEEAVASGITDILMIVGSGKRAVEEHFAPHFALEHTLEEKGKTELLESIRAISDLADIHFIWQKELNGLGDAIRYARHHVGQEPFAVLLGDSIMDSHIDKPVTKQLLEVYEKHQAPVIAISEVEPQFVSRYGILDAEAVESGVFRIHNLIEKPSPAEAPSNLAISGAYILTADIFTYLDQVQPGVNNEIQLTDALAMMLQDSEMYGLAFDGVRYDVGNKLDFIKTNLIFGLKRPEMQAELLQWMQQILEQH